MLCPYILLLTPPFLDTGSESNVYKAFRKHPTCYACSNLPPVCRMQENMKDEKFESGSAYM